MKEAKYYTHLDGKRLQCRLCPHNCIIKDGGRGICGVRKNSNSILYSEIYGEVTSIAMDPIEKKPLYHFYPSSSILSIGTKGCNLKCPYCQNWHISQDLTAGTTYYDPANIVHLARRKGSTGIAYTYSEPVIWLEYVLDTSILASKAGLKNVLVTNGFVNSEPLKELLNYTDAMNIDLKSFNDETYKKIQKGNLDSLLKTINTVNDSKCHLEITTLIVTGINDNINEMKEIINFISSMNKNIPWHISRYYPNYKYNKNATDIDFIFKIYDEAVKKLNYVYCGNIPPGRNGNNTLCPSCKTILIERRGYSTGIHSLKKGLCEKCGTETGIIN